MRPGGTVAVFDGNYASLTFAYPDHGMATTVEKKLMQLIVANPRVMRDMPRLVAEAGLDLIDAAGTLYADIGRAHFWLAAAESYGPILARSGLLTPGIVNEWRAFPGPICRRQHLLRCVELLHLPDATTAHAAALTTRNPCSTASDANPANRQRFGDGPWAADPTVVNSAARAGSDGEQLCERAEKLPPQGARPGPSTAATAGGPATHSVSAPTSRQPAE